MSLISPLVRLVDELFVVELVEAILISLFEISLASNCSVVEAIQTDFVELAIKLAQNLLINGELKYILTRSLT